MNKITQTKFAMFAGVSRQAIYKAINNGRLLKIGSKIDIDDDKSIEYLNYIKRKIEKIKALDEFEKLCNDSGKDFKEEIKKIKNKKSKISQRKYTLKQKAVLAGCRKKVLDSIDDANVLSNLKRHINDSSESYTKTTDRYYFNLNTKITSRLTSRLTTINKKNRTSHRVADLSFTVKEYVAYVIFLLERDNIANKFLFGKMDIHHKNRIKKKDAVCIKKVNEFFHYNNIEILTEEEHNKRHTTRCHI